MISKATSFKTKCYDCGKRMEFFGIKPDPKECLCQMCDPCMNTVEGNKWRSDVQSWYMFRTSGVIRTEQAFTVQDACQKAFGIVYKKGVAQYKNIGKKRLGDLSEKKQHELMTENTWLEMP